MDDAYRTSLLRKFDAALGNVVDDQYPRVPRVVALKLKSEAIAKSHRPIDLIVDAGLLPAGHGAIDEVLVGVEPASTSRVRSTIADRNTARIRANLSAIADIVPWDPSRLARVDSFPSSSDSLFLELFSYDRFSRQIHSIDEIVESELLALLLRLTIDFEKLTSTRGTSIFVLRGTGSLPVAAVDAVLDFPGIRAVSRDPLAFGVQSFVGEIAHAVDTSPVPFDGSPVVAVFDTGVSAGATSLVPWIHGSETYVLPVETDYAHGTFVSSLVAYADTLNGHHQSFPFTGCKVLDVCGLESAGARTSDLMLRIADAVSKHPDVKVWNLSLGTRQMCDDSGFSIFGRELDRISDLNSVLFVVAAGNYGLAPVRPWPPGAHAYQDRVCGPADSVRSLTVGAVAHLDSPGSFVKSNEPACYSRRGPGPVFTPKPDLVHVGGNVEAPWESGTLGVAGLLPDNSIGRDSGTSFAAPIVSALAAQVWAALRGGQTQVTPDLVKGLLIHAAELASPHRSPLERRYYGSGIPSNPLGILYDSPDSFTMYFQANLTSASQRWRKDPFPLPAPLIHGGKLRAEVVMTTIYSPPVDSNAGAEYVRANVETAFGTISGSNAEFHGQVPLKGELGTDGYEKAQVEHGGKWSPVKVARKTFPLGVGGLRWALQANLLLRALEPPLSEPLTVHIFLTLRAVDPSQVEGTSVYEAGVQALQTMNWITSTLPISVPINVQT
ncbi:S8 family peptidase [Pseudoxanthomonas mexicana]